MPSLLLFFQADALIFPLRAISIPVTASRPQSLKRVWYSASSFSLAGHSRGCAASGMSVWC